MAIIKLDICYVAWAKRFNRTDGEDGFSVVEKNGTLIASCDLQHFSSERNMGLQLLK
jgi:hypothetical protein